MKTERSFTYAGLSSAQKRRFKWLMLRHRVATWWEYFRDSICCSCFVRYAMIEENDTVLVTRLILEAQAE